MHGGGPEQHLRLLGWRKQRIGDTDQVQEPHRQLCLRLHRLRLRRLVLDLREAGLANGKRSQGGEVGFSPGELPRCGRSRTPGCSPNGHAPVALLFR